MASKMSFAILLLLGLVTTGLCQIYQTNPVQTEAGTVVGLYLSTVLRKVPYFSFKGIPYAEAPVGNLRLKPPHPKQPWQDTLYAFNDQSSCLQLDRASGDVVGSEDCLYLNVYSPNTNTFGTNNVNGLKPVIVWIHGGSFTTGNGNSSYYGPDFLLEGEVVVVTVQYRLGPLGFLNINHPEASGNYGLKDQNMALQWVQRNINKFGGDPKRVTLFGQSAGGVAVDLHKLSDMSTGLFQQTISMSASPLCKYWPFQSRVEAEAQAYALGDKFGVKKGDANGLVKKLMTVSAVDIIKKANELLIIPFRPTLESTEILPGQPKFLTECAPKKYHEGNYNKGPHMMGFTSNEILSMAKTFDELVLWHKDAAASMRKLPFVKSLPVLPEFLAVKFEAIASLKKVAFTHLIEQLSDIYFVTGIDMKQRLLAETNKAPVYYYKYDFKSPESAHRSEGIEILDGVAHEDELPHLFRREHLKISLTDPSIARHRDRLIIMWTNFARYGNPTPFCEKDARLDGITWPDSGKDGIHLAITDKLTVGPRPTNVLITLYQKFGFGDSSIYNDCSPTVLHNIINSLATIPNSASEIIGGATGYFNQFKGTVTGTVNTIGDVLSGGKNEVDTFVSSIIKVKKDAFTKTKDVIKGTGSTIGNEVHKGIGKISDGITNLTGKVMGGITINLPWHG